MCDMQVAVAFVRRTSELVLEGGSHLQVGWRRSAIAFLADLLRPAPAHALHPSVLEALRGATAALNRALQRAELPGLLAPRGLPASHWWWSPRSCAASSSGGINTACQVASPA